MALCCSKKVGSKDQDDSEPAVKSGLVPSSHRKCRDVICLLLFIVYWVGMGVVAVIGMQSGQPMSLVYGRDFNGSVCGDGDMATRPLTAYPRLNEDMLNALAHNVPLTKMPLFGVCVPSCPLLGDQVCTYDNATCWTASQDTKAILFRCMPLNSQNETIVSQKCVDPVDADPSCTVERFLKNQCAKVCKTKKVQKTVWEVEATTPNPIMDQLQGYAQTLGRFIGDTHATAGLILAVGGGGALLLGIVWLVVLQFFAGCMVWLTCWLVIAGLVLMSLFCSVRSGLIDATEALSFLDTTGSSSSSSSMGLDASDLEVEADATTRNQFKVAAYIMWVLTGAIFLLVLAMRRRIKIAIAIIREASRAIRTLPLLLLWPIVPTVLFIVLVVYAIAVAAYIISSTDLSSVVESTAALAEAAAAAAKAQAASSSSSSSGSSINGTITDAVSELPSDTLQQILLGYHLFGFLWTNQLIQAISITTIAGSVAQYYWTVPTSTTGHRKLETRFPIVRALKYVLFYSLGSLCFGSFIIALVQFMRIILEYIDHQTKELQKTNAVIKVAFLAVRCCLWCFEKCLKFLSKNAYIIIAMRGSSFCSASVASFKLIFANIARVAVVNAISFFMMFLIKATITLAVGGGVFVILSSASASSSQLEVFGSTQPVTSPMAPVLVSCILAWLVASSFANVYDAAIDTILLCFCEDTAINGENGSEYMSDELQRIMGGGSGKRKVIQVASKSGSDLAASGGGDHGAAAATSKVHVDAEVDI